MSLYKIIKIACIVLGVIGVIYFLMILIAGEETIIETGKYLDGFIYLSYIVMAIALIFVATFVIKGIISTNIMKTLIPVGVFAVIILISYLLADGSETVMKDGTTLSSGESRWIGAGLYVFYIVAILALGTMLFTGVKKINR